MADDCLGEGEICCHKKSRPENCMESEDIFADEMNCCRPEFLEKLHIPIIPDACQVVVERVKPDINGMVRIVRHGNSPLHCGSGNT